jgi:hypothetical protein
MFLENTALDTIEIPNDILRGSLRHLVGHDRFRITKCGVTEMKTSGFSGNRFLRTVIEYDVKGERRSSLFVVKRWTSESWTAIATDSSRSREALAWENGFIIPEGLPPGMIVPFVFAQEDSSGA